MRPNTRPRPATCSRRREIVPASRGAFTHVHRTSSSRWEFHGAAYSALDPLGAATETAGRTLRRARRVRYGRTGCRPGPRAPPRQPPSGPDQQPRYPLRLPSRPSERLASETDRIEKLIPSRNQANGRLSNEMERDRLEVRRSDKSEIRALSRGQFSHVLAHQR